jgi:hypothetical protein
MCQQRLRRRDQLANHPIRSELESRQLRGHITQFSAPVSDLSDDGLLPKAA